MEFKKILFLLCFSLVSFSIVANPPGIEKIVVIRHGEKPPFEIGQLNCQGLNRSMLLPLYFSANFPNPDYIFAPDPAIPIDGVHNYIRPLATIEPTAIGLNLPVNTRIGFLVPHQLMTELLKTQYHQSLIYVAWEHINIEIFSREILDYFFNLTPVPFWPDSEYNRVYVFTIDWNNHTIKFAQTTEGLSNISQTCPWQQK